MLLLKNFTAKQIGKLSESEAVKYFAMANIEMIKDPELINQIASISSAYLKMDYTKRQAAGAEQPKE